MVAPIMNPPTPGRKRQPGRTVPSQPAAFTIGARRRYGRWNANPNYWGGKPKVDRLIFKVMPDAQAALLALKKGDVHILADVSVQTVPAIKMFCGLIFCVSVR